MDELKDLFGFSDDSVKMSSGIPIGENVEGFQFVSCGKSDNSQWDIIEFNFKYKGSDVSFTQFVPDPNNPKPFPNESKQEAIKRGFVALNSFFYNIAEVWGFADEVRDTQFNVSDVDEYWDELIDLFNKVEVKQETAYAKIMRNKKGYAKIGYKLPVFSNNEDMFYAKSEKKYLNAIPNDKSTNTMTEEESSLL